MTNDMQSIATPHHKKHQTTDDDYGREGKQGSDMTGEHVTAAIKTMPPTAADIESWIVSRTTNNIDMSPMNTTKDPSDTTDSVSPLLLLPEEILVDHIFAFVGKGRYRYVAGTSRAFRRLYKQAVLQQQQQQEGSKQLCATLTFEKSIVESVSCAELCRKEASEKSIILNAICRGRWKLQRTPVITIIGIMAASCGNIDILAWAQKQGCALIHSTCKEAAANGHLAVLKWMRLQEGFKSWDSGICNDAARNGHLEVLQWLRQEGCDWDANVCSFAALNGHLKVLQWSHQNGCEWDSWTCARAAQNGHLEVLQWARQNGCNWDERTCDLAALNGHLEVLQWARQNGCNWDSSWTCARAAQNGHLEVLQWARQNGCEWDSRTCTLAAQNGQLEALQWARQNGCEWNWWTVASAAQNGHMDVVQWAQQNGCRT